MKFIIIFIIIIGVVIIFIKIIIIGKKRSSARSKYVYNVNVTNYWCTIEKLYFTYLIIIFRNKNKSDVPLEIGEDTHQPQMEESFTIHLGIYKQLMHIFHNTFRYIIINNPCIYFTIHLGIYKQLMHIFHNTFRYIIINNPCIYFTIHLGIYKQLMHIFAIINYLNLGAQEKSSHNLRLLCGDLATFCQHADGDGNVEETKLKLTPQHIQSALSVYTTNISAIIVTVDQEINTIMGPKEGMLV